MHDSHQRSIAKGITWRLVGSVDTAVLSFFFTRNTGQSLQIASAEFISKIILYYLHERFWQRLNIGRRSIQLANGNKALLEAHWRSILKGVSWRITGTIDTIFWAAVITGEITIAMYIGAAELITKVILFYLHERVWMLIKWGRKPHNLVPEIPDSTNQTNAKRIIG